MLKNRNMQAILGVFIFLIIVNSSISGMNVLSQLSAYSTGYQGARAQYSGVQYEQKQYTQAETHGASRARFDTTLSFDPDAQAWRMPNLAGEMTAVFIPSESLSNLPSWIPSEWQRSIQYISNPKNSWEWELENKSYVMEEWICRWYFSISAEWDDSKWLLYKDNEWGGNYYANTEVWFQIDLNPMWYFEGADTAYFAIAKMQMADVRLDARDNQGNIIEPDKSVSVTPSSQGSIMPIYHGQFSKGSQADKTTMSYQGKELNPDLFTSRVYTYFTLEHFGTNYWLELAPFPTNRYKGDVVTVAVDVHLFVIGEWDVKDIESIEQIEGTEGYGRTAKVGGAGFSIGDWLALPENRLLLVLIAGLLIFLFLAMFAPMVLMTIFALFGSGKRRR